MASLRARIEGILSPSAARRTLPYPTRRTVPPNTPPLVVGVVGFGAIGRRHAKGLAGHPAFGLVGIAAHERGRAAAREAGFAVFDDVAALLSQGLDALVVATPHPSHAEIVAEALRAGCHVLCEKPLALEADEARSLGETAAATGRVLATAFQTRFRPEFRFVRDLVAAGTLGHPAMKP